jgi:hypothetical protein
MKDVTAIVVNWLTAERTLHAVQTFLKVYPDVPLIIVDDDSNEKEKSEFFGTYNGHGYNPQIDYDPDTDKLKNIPGTKFIQVPPHNLHPKGHGNAMDFAAKHIKTRWMFMFHSDYRFIKRGVIEELMLDLDETFCAAGDNKTRHEKMLGLADVNVIYNLELGKKHKLSFKPVIYYNDGTFIPFPVPEGVKEKPNGKAIEDSHYYTGKLAEMGYKIKWVNSPHQRYGVHLRWQEGDNSEWEKYY